MPEDSSGEGSEGFPDSGDQPTHLVDITDTAMLETAELPAPATAAEPVAGTVGALPTTPLPVMSAEAPSLHVAGSSGLSVDRPGRPPGGGGPTVPPPARSPSPQAHMPDQDPLYKYGDGVTRMLCSCVHLFHPMAKQICDTLLGGQYNAAAPQWGVDLVALMRHSRESVQRWDARDQQLRWVTLVGAAIALFAAAIHRLGALPLWITVIVWACVPAFVMVTSFAIVFWHYAGTRARAVAAVKDTGTPIRDLAGAALSADDVAALEELATANVVTFEKSFPFGTDGWLLEDWTLSIDLERARRRPQAGFAETGPPIEPTEVTASAVHRHLEHSLARGPLAGVRVEQRLYVRGNAARKVEGLCEGWTHAKVRPRARIERDVIESYIDKPEVFARTYVAAQRAIWGGQTVVTVLVHVRRNGSILHIEGSEHVLPPLKARFAKVGDFPTGRWRVFKQTWQAAQRSTGHQVQQCWPRLYKARKAARSWAKVCRQNERKHRDGVVFNYGVSGGFREAWSDPKRMIYFASGDEVMSTVPLRRAVLRSLSEYVESCGYDVTDLREQEKQIDMIGVVRLSDAAARMKPMGSAKPA